MNGMKKACVYARVSPDEQVKECSLEEQERMCKLAIWSAPLVMDTFDLERMDCIQKVVLSYRKR